MSTVKNLWTLFDRLFRSEYKESSGDWKRCWNDRHKVTARFYNKMDFDLLKAIADRYLEDENEDASDCLTFAAYYRLFPNFWKQPNTGFGWIYEENYFDKYSPSTHFDEVKSEEPTCQVSLSRFRHIRDTFRENSQEYKFYSDPNYINFLVSKNLPTGLIQNVKSIAKAYKLLIEYWKPFTPSERTEW